MTSVNICITLYPFLQFLWPWVGFYLNLPGLVIIYFCFRFFAGRYYEELKDETAAGIVMALAAIAIFIFFDNLLVYPFFIAPVLWPEQPLFFNFWFPEGLIDIFANSILIIVIGLRIQRKFFGIHSDKINWSLYDFVKFLLKAIKIGFFMYASLVILFLASKNEIKSNIYLLELSINWITPSIETIRIAIWLTTLYFINRWMKQKYIERINRILAGNIAINATLNFVSTPLQLIFLYPIDFNQYFANISWLTAIFIKYAYTLQSILLIFSILVYACLKFINLYRVKSH